VFLRSGSHLALRASSCQRTYDDNDVCKPPPSSRLHPKENDRDEKTGPLSFARERKSGVR
jgi:hypothetical protein